MDLIRNIIQRIKLKRSMVLFLSIVLTAFLYIGSPFNEPTIRIGLNSEFFKIKLPYNFQSCTINFKNPVFISKYSAMRSIDQNLSKSIIKQFKIGQKTNELKIENLLSKNNSTGNQEVLVFHDKMSAIEIVDVKINDEKIKIKKFYNNNLLSKFKKLHKYYFIREDLAFLILKYNDFVSNIILTILTIYLIPLLYELVIKIFYCVFLKRYESYLKGKYSFLNKKDFKIAEISLADKYSNNERRYRFLQIFGPAIGFILTISSLIAGLHPSLQKAYDIERFFENIQIAMVSTFIGLFMRILAIFLQKFDSKLFVEADNILFKLRLNFKREKIEKKKTK